jgi:hypothetical protein
MYCICNACHNCLTQSMAALLLHPEHIWDSTEEWTWLWCSNWQHFVLSVECGTMLKKERKESFLVFLYKTFSSERWMNPKRIVRHEGKKETFQRYTVNLKRLDHAILDDVPRCHNPMIQYMAFSFFRCVYQGPFLSSTRKHSFLNVDGKLQENISKPTSLIDVWI